MNTSHYTNHAAVDEAAALSPVALVASLAVVLFFAFASSASRPYDDASAARLAVTGAQVQPPAGLDWPVDAAEAQDREDHSARKIMTAAGQH